ncbi:MAG: Crp/Fnr family transcriptional regulator [Thermodesulfobacteriota bacterium]
MHHLDTRQIKQLHIFRDLLPNEWEQVYPLLSHVRVIEGEQLLREGERAHSFFVILKGHFMIYKSDGRAMSLRYRGDIMGWSSVTFPFAYTAGATALTDGEVLCISGGEFLELLQSNPALAEKVLRRINEFVNTRQKIGALQ